jgi:hypothetical protein
MTEKTNKYVKWTERNVEIMCDRLEDGNPYLTMISLFEFEDIWGTFDYHQQSEIVLQCAIRTKDVKFVSDFIEKERTHGLFDFHTEDEGILTAAIATGKTDMVSWLLSKSSTVGSFQIMRNHLMCALCMSTPSVINTLIEYPSREPFDIGDESREYIETVVSRGTIDNYDTIITKIDPEEIDIHHGDDKILRMAIRSENLGMIERVLAFPDSFDFGNYRLVKELKYCKNIKIVQAVLVLCAEQSNTELYSIVRKMFKLDQEESEDTADFDFVMN